MSPFKVKVQTTHPAEESGNGNSPATEAKTGHKTRRNRPLKPILAARSSDRDTGMARFNRRMVESSN
ncbi:hypothetical protein HYR99_18070 [Candidatus Poribacteria bacterium]|nr:hypothetical protein [Candidatus Poribacteria bacterium]